jgi:MarR family transcriptional regulator, lower aerobic nicotinate degradation pathway regulator
MGPPGPELGLLLRLAHQRAAKAFSEALQPLGLEGRHVGVLMTLARLGPSTQSQLIAELGSDKSSMVRTVDDLEHRGLAARRPVPGDRRARSVDLTTTGRERLASATTIAQHVGDDLFGCLTGREQATLRELLSRIVAAGAARAGS